MLNSADTFSSSGTVLSIDEKEFGEKKKSLLLSKLLKSGN